jgi:hypothetical protein
MTSQELKNNQRITVSIDRPTLERILNESKQANHSYDHDYVWNLLYDLGEAQRRIKSCISEQEVETREHEEKLKGIETRLNLLRDKCTHSWKTLPGSTPGESYNKCQLCGLESNE